MKGFFRNARLTLLAATVASAILVASPSVMGSFGVPKLVALVTLSFLSLAAALAYAATGRGRKAAAPALRGARLAALMRSPWPALGALVLGTLISTAASLDVGVSLIGRYNRYGGLLTFAAFLAFFAAASIRPERRTGTVLLFACALSTAAAAFYGVFQTFGLDPIAWAPTDGTKVFATFGNSSFAGAAMGIGLVTFAGSALLTRISLRPLWLLPAIAAGVSAVSARSNGFLLALLFGALFLAVGLRRQYGIRLVKVAGAAVAVVAVVAVIGAAAPGAPPPFGTAGRAVRESMHPRAEYWGAALRSFASRPLSGWGPETFAEVFPRYRSAANAREQGLAKLTDEIHNVFLQRFAEGGLITGVAWLLLIAQGLAASARPPRKKKRETLLASGCALLAAYAAQSLFSIDVISLSIYMWSGLAIIQCSRELPGEGSKERGKGRRPKARGRESDRREKPLGRAVATTLWIGSLAALIAAAGGGVLVSRNLLGADREFTLAQRNSTGFEDSDRHYRRAVELNPYESRYRAAWSLLLEEEYMRRSGDVNFYERAIALGEEAFRREPGNPYHAVRLAIFNENLARRLAADASTNPNTPEAENYRRALEEAGRWYRRALEFDPKDPDLIHSLCLVESKLARLESGTDAGADCPPPSDAAARAAASKS